MKIWTLAALAFWLGIAIGTTHGNGDDEKAADAEQIAPTPAAMVASISMAGCDSAQDEADILRATRQGDEDTAALLVSIGVNNGNCILLPTGAAVAVVSSRDDLVRVRQVDQLRAVWVPAYFLGTPK